jgi:hypothetical protein
MAGGGDGGGKPFPERSNSEGRRRQRQHRRLPEIPEGVHGFWPRPSRPLLFAILAFRCPIEAYLAEARNQHQGYRAAQRR